MKRHHLNTISIILYFIFILNASIDMGLSYHATTTQDYYETNPFTQKYGFGIHFTFLIISVLGISVFMLALNMDIMLFIFMVMINLIWTINNVLSVVMMT